MDEENVIKSLDLRGKSIENLSPDEIPPKTIDLYLSNNKITKLPEDIFFEKCRIWNIFLDYNMLNDLQFITCFQYLGTLDLRHNCLELNEILVLRKIHILHLYLADNNFQKFTNSNSLTIPALLKRAWTIDGVFITDHIRHKSKEFKKTKQFGEIILAARRNPIPVLNYESVSNAAKSFLAGTCCRFEDPSRFLNSTGINIEFLTKKPQPDRLLYLSNSSDYRLPEGGFFDLFGIALGILSHHWCGFPIQIIPRIISRAFWSLTSEIFNNIENWGEFVILSKIEGLIRPTNEKEIDVWSRINLRKYLQQGTIPQLGTFPRLLISSIVYRSEELNDNILKSEDMMIYTKFRNSYDFGPVDRDFDCIYDEFNAEIPYEATIYPHKNDLVSIRHPFTNEWTSSPIVELAKGRAIFKVDNRFFQPMALVSLFWDGRGLFREKQKIENKIKMSPSKLSDDDDTTFCEKHSKLVNKRKTFLTIADTLGDTESTKQDADKFSIPLPPYAIPSKNILPREDPSYFLRTSQSALSNRTVNSIDSAKCTNPSISRNVNINVNEPKLIKMKLRKKSKNTRNFATSQFDHPLKKAIDPRTFRGIVDPISSRQKKTFVKAAPTRKPSQIVDRVVNISFGPEIGNCRQIRIFHVRVLNTITKKFSYVNIKEDEIPPEDAERLIELFKKHIESKMIIVPDK